MKNKKLSVLQDYNKLDDELKEKVKLVYPNGFSDSIIEFTDKKRRKTKAIRFETDEKVYMLRLSKKMMTKIIEEAEE